MDSERIVKIGTVIIITAALVVLSFVAAPYIMGFFEPDGEQTTVGYTSETVRAEVLNIQEEGYFGDQKRVVKDGYEIWELRWKT